LATATRPCSDGLYSNYGVTTVDLAAPGCEVCCARRVAVDPVNPYTCGSSGTSLATPIVAGAAALLWKQNPTWTNLQVKDRILSEVDVLPSLQGRMLSNGRLNLEKALDNIGPGAVDLTITSYTNNSVDLSWTAPGDDGYSGTAVEFDLRYSTSTITEANFGSATQFANEPVPGPSGTVHSCITVPGLNQCTVYNFAIKTRDDANNWSSLSNVPSVKTKCSPGGPICEGGGMFAQGGGDGGWTPENSVLSLTGSQATDAYRLKGTAGPIDGNYVMRLLKVGTGHTDVDLVSVGTVDHGSSVSPFVSSSGVVLGTTSTVQSATDGAGTDVTSLTAGSSTQSYAALAGQSLLVTIGGSASSDTCLVIESSGYRPSASADSTGILVQVQRSDGSWRTLDHIYPRRSFDPYAVDTDGCAAVRLLFLGDHWVRSIRRLNMSGTATPQALTLANATHSRLGDVSAAVGSSGGSTTTLVDGDLLNLGFGATAVPSGKVRDLFLRVRGTYSTQPAGRASDVALASSEEKFEYALGPARPNPSMGSVTIQYTLAQESLVSIRVFDVAGRLVKNLVSENGAAGPHDVTWDATDDRGLRVAAGVYFYRMLAGSWMSQRKVVFLER